MSRTNRTHMSDGNYREARGGKAAVARANAATDAYDAEHPLLAGTYEATRRIREQFTPPLAMRHTRGGMLMSSRQSGRWSDDSGGKRIKRAVKRSERQRAMRDALNY